MKQVIQNSILLTPHFALREFVESTTARKHGIANTPTAEAVENLRRLCVNTLEPLRETLGLPVIITSGYRCRQLNDIIGHHSSQSQHLRGLAADFYVGWGSTEKSQRQSGNSHTPRERLIKAFRTILSDDSVDFDQLILYPTFIHVSYVSAKANRHHIMVAQDDGKYGHISRTTALTIE